MIRNLQAYHERVAQELASARAMQQALLPQTAHVETLANRHRVRIGSHFEASSELGGYPVRACTDGLRCRDGGYWNDGTQNQFPDWVQVAWPQPQCIGAIRAALPFTPATLRSRTRVATNSA